MINLLLGDSCDVLRSIPDNSIDAVVTDPPYGISFMNKHWDYDVPTVSLWKEVLRVLKPGGHMLVFGGTRTYHRLVVAIEDAGFEVRDQIQWIFGSGFPKSHNISKGIDKKFGAEREVVGQQVLTGTARLKGVSGYGASCGKLSEVYAKNELQESISLTKPATDLAKEWDGWGTALKPAFEPLVWATKPFNVDLFPANEPICLARKPLSEKTVVDNVLKWGTGALNIDASRILSNAQRPDNNRAWENGELLCISCAKLAEQNNTHSVLAIKESIAIKNAELTSKESLAGKPLHVMNKMDTGCSDGILTGSINASLNTFTYGKDKTEQNQQGLLSTTLMKTEKTTELKICSLCHEEITPDSMCQSIPILRKETQSMQKEQGSSGQNSRWPSNVLFDEQAAEALDEQTSGKLHSAGKPRQKVITGKYNASSYHAPTERQSNRFDDKGFSNASRFFYCAKASQSERNRGLEDQRNVHPTVKPIKLLKYLITLITPPGGTVLDPFLGSGSTAVACKELRVSCIGIEIDAQYIQIAEARIKAS